MQRHHFHFKADANGYMIYYKRVPIGGAGVKLPREKPLHWRHRDANLAENKQSAERDITAILEGRGRPDMVKRIKQIDKE